MNKQHLAMAVAAAMFAPTVASADVTVYGRVQAEYNIEDRDCTGCDSVQSVDDNGGMSRLGVKFSEKLGGGLTAFGKAEFRIDPADNNSVGTNGDAASVSGALGQRDIHAGIKGSWGSLAAGSFHSPYKTAGGVKWDPWAATHLQARRAGGMTGGAGIGGHNGFMR
ncbi:MAG: porin, partial [Granulosicoccaceae bacterium]